MGDMQVDSRAQLLDGYQRRKQSSVAGTGLRLAEVWENSESRHALTPAPGARGRRGYAQVFADFVRRTADVIGAFAGLAVVFPVLGIVAILVRLNSPGDPIYGSWRLTTNGKRFRCWKVRTMYEDSDRRLKLYLACSPGARLEYQRFHKLEHDPRVTRIGRFLRATSLDELPQLFNVLMGEMSLVGPRPYLVDELHDLPEARVILTVKPGITGLWQVSGRNERTFRQRLRIESFYSRRRSLGWDAALLARTVGVVVRGRGAQ